MSGPHGRADSRLGGRCDDIVAALSPRFTLVLPPTSASVTDSPLFVSLYDLARRLKLVDCIDRHVPRRGVGLSVGTYILAAALNRCLAPWHIDQAIRFVLPNSRMRRKVYIHLATRSTNSTSGPRRLRGGAGDAEVRHPAGGRRHPRADRTERPVHYRHMERAARGPLDLGALQVADFERVAGGDRFNYAGNCARTTPLFYDGFELGGLVK